jgi:hypothetical protein
MYGHKQHSPAMTFGFKQPRDGFWIQVDALLAVQYRQALPVLAQCQQKDRNGQEQGATAPARQCRERRLARELFQKLPAEA